MAEGQLCAEAFDDHVTPRDVKLYTKVATEQNTTAEYSIANEIKVSMACTIADRKKTC